MDSTNTSPTLREAIAEVRAKGIVVVKTARNTGIQSDYASYADVWEALKPALDSAGLTVGFLPSKTRKDNEAWIQELVMEISCGAYDRTVPFEVLFPEGNRGVNLTQRQGMAHTYGKRYALIDFFHLITGDDDDAQRLGQTPRENAAPTPDKTAHWSEFCHVAIFGVGSEETAGTWAPMADPSDDTGERCLGDNAGGVMAKLWAKYPDHPGINAWRAELIKERAIAKNLMDWEKVVKTYRSLNLPELFAECTGEHLNNLALALK